MCESYKDPIKYYLNNVSSTIALCEMMLKYNVKKMIFSSSATVYGSCRKMPITEDFPLAPTNPYGRTQVSN
jgi:UDP-glucose 4-epimerase